MRGRGWGSEGCEGGVGEERCERAGLEEERVCEGGVGGKEGCERVWLEEEKGCEGILTSLFILVSS